MTDKNHTPQAEDASQLIIQDVLYRMRHIETNLPPRVQVLEGAVEEIRQDFKEMREESRAASQRNEENIDRLATIFTESTNRLSEKHSEDFQKLSEGFNAVGRKIAFGAGCWAAAVTVIGLVVAYSEEINNFLKAVGAE